jgi:hypothetical protein
MKKVIILLFLAVSLTSCDVLLAILGAAAEQGTKPANNALTNDDVVSGLKSALAVGTDSAVTHLMKKDGFFRDEAVKIFLPPEAKVIIESINKVPGGKGLLEDVYLRVNRAAEDAAVEAKPIFVNAIRDISITDGINILRGRNTASPSTFDSTAATNYLKDRTKAELVKLFQPKIDQSLDKKLVGNISTNDAWTKLTTAYNLVAPFMGKEKINTSLSGYVTDKAIDGLYYKVGLEEKKIRKNPFKWSVSIIQKVFGSVFK